MKKYKNIAKATVLYAIGAGWYFLFLLLGSWLNLPVLTPVVANIINGIALWPPIVIALIGVFYSLRSIKSKESSWAGLSLIFVGGIVIFLPYILFFIIARL